MLTTRTFQCSSNADLGKKLQEAQRQAPIIRTKFIWCVVRRTITDRSEKFQPNLEEWVIIYDDLNDIPRPYTKLQAISNLETHRN